MSENYTHINDDLLVKYLLDETSPEEKTAVQQWIAADEANKKYFDQLSSVWNESRRLSATSEVNEDAAWNRFRERIHKQEQSVVVPIKKRTGWMRIAALFIVVAGLGLAVYTLSKGSAPVQQLAMQAHDQPVVDTLPDGSVISLNKNSSLSYPEKFKGDKRLVALKGEAFFEVVPDRKKPFEIQVNDITVKVVGTSFNIRSENGQTEVIVETGIVQVIRGGQVVELRPGQKISVGPQDSTLAPRQEEEKLYQYYRSKEFVCDNTPLWKLVEVLNEAYGVNIVIERPELRNLPLDVTFSNESLDVILEIIKMTFNNYNIEIRKTGDKIILR